TLALSRCTRSKLTMASKKDAAAALAEELIRRLASQRHRGPAAYPLTVGQLQELVKEAATPAQSANAIGKRAFQNRVVIARAKDRGAPIALAGDLEALAGSRLLLEFMLQSL